MRRPVFQDVVVPVLAALALLSSVGCRKKAGGPKSVGQSVGTARVVRRPVDVRVAGKKKPVETSLRLADGNRVSVGKGGRALLSLDRGAVVLVDRSSSVTVHGNGLSVERGRVYVEAGGELTVETPAGILRAASTGFDVAVDGAGKVRVYCAAGEVFYRAKGQGRFKSIGPGITLSMSGGKASLLPEEVWDDWTSGMARAGQAGRGAPAGIGILEGRWVGGYGRAPEPLILRDHKVKVTLDKGFARTTVTQTFFNPKSWPVEAFYRVTLPEGAILESVDHGTTVDTLVRDEIRSRSRLRGSVSPSFLLEKAGQGVYSGRLANLGPGMTFVIRIRYGQWLDRRADRLSYRYPMGGADAPMVSEFSLVVDLAGIKAKGLSASLGATVSDNKVQVTRSDFHPRSDFVLEMKVGKSKGLTARYAAARDGRERKVFLVSADLPLPAGKDSLDVVVVADRSAGLSDAQMQLVGDTLAAVLDQLKVTDRVAVLAASDDVVDLGAGLAAADEKMRKALLERFSKLAPAGATNLGAALRRATALLPAGKGIVLYVGDGRPTTGPTRAEDILAEVRRVDRSARLFALGIGNDADIAFLEGLVREPGAVARVDNRQQAAAAVFRLLSRAARPALRQVRVSFDGDVARVYPSRPVVVTADRPLTVLARSNGKLPTKMTVEAVSNGKHMEKVYKLAFQQVRDEGDLTRRWAAARVRRLIEEGAGREMIADLGMRYGLVTAFTAFASPSAKAYDTLLPDAPASVVSVESLMGVQRVALGNLAIEPHWFGKRQTAAPWNWIYGRLLESRSGPVRLCFERKASVHPELSGVVDLAMELRSDGSFKSVETTYSSLGDSEVVSCVKRAVATLKLPPPPPGAPMKFAHRFTFSSPLAWDRGGQGCSKASRRYLAVRRILWRERLLAHSDVGGAVSLWHQARVRCELKTWLDRQTLLDLILKRLRSTAKKVRFYNSLSDPSAKSYVRRRILATLRTRQDVVVAARGLNPDGVVDWELLDKALGKDKTDAARLKTLRRFLALAPSSLFLRKLAMRIASRMGRFDEAERYARTLRSDPGTDVVTRLEIGRFLLGRGKEADARKAMSEVVEMAPTDPFARRMLARAYLAEGWCGLSAREYRVLIRLTPADPMARLGLAQAALCDFRVDHALRLMAQVGSGAEIFDTSGPAGAARVLLSQTLALLSAKPEGEATGKTDGASRRGKSAARKGSGSKEKSARKPLADRLGFGPAWLKKLRALRVARGEGVWKDWLASMRRRVGQKSWGGQVLVIAQWRSVSSSVALFVQYQGQELRPASLSFPSIGLAAVRLRRKNVSPYFEVRLSDRSRVVAEMPFRFWVLTGEDGESPRMWTRIVTLDQEHRALAFRLAKGQLVETKVRRKKEKKD